MPLILNVEGIGKVEITNWKEIEKKIISAIGFQVVPEIQKEILRMKLKNTTDFWQSIESEVVNNKLIVFSTVDYAPYLEYGTFSYWKRYGLGSFPEPGYPTIPKKKEILPSEARKLPKGMQPFAPMRRVLWNKNKMNRIVQKAFNAASSTSK